MTVHVLNGCPITLKDQAFLVNPVWWSHVTEDLLYVFVSHCNNDGFLSCMQTCWASKVPQLNNHSNVHTYNILSP